jgi:hypothetical protein
MNMDHVKINNQINDQIINLLFDLSEKIILNIESNLFDTLGKMIDGKFVSNTLINICKFTYNEIYKYMGTKSLNESVNEFIQIQKIFPHDLLCILKISFGMTIEIIKNLNRSFYDFTSEDKFIKSIQNQFELIKNVNFEYFDNFIKNHICDDSIGTADLNKKYF